MKKDRIKRIKDGLRKAAEKGRRGGAKPKVTEDQIRAAIPLGTLAGAAAAGVSRSTFIRWRRKIEESAENG